MVWSELELRWVVLGLGLLVILGVFLAGLLKSRSRPSGTPRSEPEIWPEESELRPGKPEAVVSATRLAQSRDGLTATGEVAGASAGASASASAGAAEEGLPSTEVSGEPPDGPRDGPAAAGVVAHTEQVVSLRLVAKEDGRLDAERTVQALREAGLRHGPYGIFHYCGDGNTPESGFSVANLVEPGSFDLSSLTGSTLPGMTFFLVLPGPRDPVERFDRMIGIARELCNELDAELLDESGNSWTIQSERYVREELIEYRRRQSGR